MAPQEQSKKETAKVQSQAEKDHGGKTEKKEEEPEEESEDIFHDTPPSAGKKEEEITKKEEEITKAHQVEKVAYVPVEPPMQAGKGHEDREESEGKESSEDLFPTQSEGDPSPKNQGKPMKEHKTAEEEQWEDLLPEPSSEIEES